MADAAFSTYPHTDRHFLIATSRSVLLIVDGLERTVTPGQPERFPGEAAVAVALRNETAQAVNLMTGRDRCVGRLEVQHLDGKATFDSPVVAVVLLDGIAQLPDGLALERLDAVLLKKKSVTLNCHSAMVALAFVDS